MAKTILDLLTTESGHLEEAGLLRKEPALAGSQGASVEIGGTPFVQLASGDYLGLATHSAVKKAAKAAIDDHGVGLAVPRMIGGTLELHVELEKAVSELLGTEDTLVYGSGWQANTGIFESMLGERDFVFCDEQCQPSLADGIRLSRARVFSHRANDMEHLEDRLRRSRGARFRAIAADGTNPLDGRASNLPQICALAAKYDAIVVVDDRHGAGVVGKSGRGTAAKLGVADQVDVVTGSFGVALGGGAGGFVSGRKSVVDWLRQKSRPYLASVALAPPCAAAALEAVRIARKDDELRKDLETNVKLFRGALAAAGLTPVESDHPAVAVVLGDAVTTQRATDLLFKRGHFAMGFCHPIVPEGAARIRAQVTAKHTQKSLKEAATAIAECVAEARSRSGGAGVQARA